ncbi:Phosphate-specific transport system accessory protein PhoU [bioreactor metagenome]|uniref:Phosphate-specific transport system accessory protein PhoU n=1 Tax=bioreactor metagenome TaxID=1076179 RepID=A0A645BMK9_9ZZZZ
MENQETHSSMRRTLEIEIQELRNDLLYLGSMVEKHLVESVDAMKKRNFDASQAIIAEDEEINQKRFSIEEKVMVVIATQQPMAHDLRLLASILEIAGELERMGDYAKGIATINLRMQNEALLKPLVDIPRMAQKDADMLHRALTAFVNEDAEAARAIPIEDDEVDNLYDQIYRELMVLIIQDPKAIERANWLLWVAHNLERVADRVTNICERTVFVVTGEMREIEHEKQ